MWLSDYDSNKLTKLNAALSENGLRRGNESLLTEIGGALTTSNITFESIRSIPDIWCIPRTYEMMFHYTGEDETFKKYKAKIISEWRALLAVIVLSNEIKIQINKMTFPKIDNEQPLIAVNALMPTSRIWSGDGEGLSWNRCVLYTMGANDMPLAMSSPTTIVVPAADAWENLISEYPGKVSWINSSGTFDIKKIGVQKARNLYYWLQKYREKLRELPIFDRSAEKMRDNIVGSMESGKVNVAGEIEQFCNDLVETYPVLKKDKRPEVFEDFIIGDMLDITPKIPSIKDFWSSVEIQDSLNKNDRTHRLFMDYTAIKTSEGFMINRKIDELMGGGIYSVGDIYRELNNKHESTWEDFEVFCDYELFLDQVVVTWFDQERERCMGGVAKEGSYEIIDQGHKRNLWISMPVTEKFIQLSHTLTDEVGVSALKYDVEASYQGGGSLL